MSLKKVEQAKKDKLFRLWDLLVYGIIILIIAVLFIAVFFTRDGAEVAGINAYYDNRLAFTYSFESDELNIALENNVRLESDADGVLTVIFCADGGCLEEGNLKDYNVIVIDKAARTVNVGATDCSNRRDCTYMSVENSSGVIICTPHRLRIEPSDYADDGQTMPVG